MSRRRKKEQLDPVQSLVFLLMGGALYGGYLLTKSLAVGCVAAGSILGLYVAIVIIHNQKHAERLKRSGIADIDKMDGRKFELYLGHLFKAHGYAAEVTKSAGDFGADLVLTKASKKIVVQAKRYSKNVSLKAVQEVHTAMNHYGATEAWVVTNADYTEQAYTLAKSNGVRLINRQQLIEMILEINPETSKMPVAKQIVEHPVEELVEQPLITELDNDECPKCGYMLVKRKSSRGEFYGCMNFPKCRHTVDIA
ncbi:hypothetical protein D3P09_02160 [Paenibacillus pinisoli]|uniref:Restriction endonuclease n=1 Tax=Paenibacillus pinisoli TaxID=1276110 RepID=A0A3A6PN97_9BACL|nr:restriction endonuclease [Paenibacillus pinisoli]RJX40848.1 hypothetical protein D3P09_02160 [Paenibacillus pinisoli]